MHWSLVHYTSATFIMMFSTTFNISVLFVEKTGVTGENTDKFYHIILYQVHLVVSVICNHNVSGNSYRQRLHR
jgi:hypothetical protein